MLLRISIIPTTKIKTRKLKAQGLIYNIRIKMMAWERRSATYATYNLILPNDVALKAALRLETETNIYLLERK